MGYDKKKKVVPLQSFSMVIETDAYSEKKIDTL